MTTDTVWNIRIYNNSTTPMADVVQLLSYVFGREQEFAFEQMLQIHQNGKADVAVFPDAQLGMILKRLEFFVEQMNKPVEYEVLSAEQVDNNLLVDEKDLLCWAEFNKQQSSKDFLFAVWVGLGIALAVAFLVLVF